MEACPCLTRISITFTRIEELAQHFCLFLSVLDAGMYSLTYLFLFVCECDTLVSMYTFLVLRLVGFHLINGPLVLS